MIRYLRTSFWPAREWQDLADLNAQVRGRCLDVAGTRRHPDDNIRTVVDAWSDERARLLPLPDDALLRLLDTWGAEAVQSAVAEAGENGIDGRSLKPGG